MCLELCEHFLTFCLGLPYVLHWQTGAFCPGFVAPVQSLEQSLEEPHAAGKAEGAAASEPPPPSPPATAAALAAALASLTRPPGEQEGRGLTQFP